MVSLILAATDIQNLDLKYKLVIADACFSAATSISQIEESRQNDTLTAEAQSFAETFGPDAAYIGWGWKMDNIVQVQDWSSKFVNNLKYTTDLGRGRTVQEAYDKFRTENEGKQDSKLMKLYRNGGNIIDPRTSEQ